jgi:uncharacterized repeat protein (TIGR01451 family)
VGRPGRACTDWVREWPSPEARQSACWSARPVDAGVGSQKVPTQNRTTPSTTSTTCPPNTAYVPDSLFCAVPGTLVYSSGSRGYISGVITWTGDLAPGDLVSLTFAITLTAPLPDRTPVTNTARLEDGHGHLHDLEAVFLARSFDLSDSSKQVTPEEVGIGGTITYVVNVYNSGAISTTGEMQDALPPELTYVPGSLACGPPGTVIYDSDACGCASGVITWTGALAPRETVLVRFQARVAAGDSPHEPITNTAVITDTFWHTGTMPQIRIFSKMGAVCHTRRLKKRRWVAHPPSTGPSCWCAVPDQGRTHKLPSGEKGEDGSKART